MALDPISLLANTPIPDPMRGAVGGRCGVPTCGRELGPTDWAQWLIVELEDPDAAGGLVNMAGRRWVLGCPEHASLVALRLQQAPGIVLTTAGEQ